MFGVGMVCCFVCFYFDVGRGCIVLIVVFFRLRYETCCILLWLACGMFAFDVTCWFEISFVFSGRGACVICTECLTMIGNRFL